MQELICIRCPMGCKLQAELIDDTLFVTGNTCRRGEEYAREELTCPRRIVTCSGKVQGASEPLSVKTESGVPKDMVFECVAAIKSLRLHAPIAIGTVVAEDICGTGVCVKATKSV